MVFTVGEGFSGNEAWIRKLEQFCQWPFQYFYYDTNILVTVFARDYTIGWFDAEKCTETMMDSNFMLPHVKVQTWDNFATEQMGKDSTLKEDAFYE